MYKKNYSNILEKLEQFVEFILLCLHFAENLSATLFWLAVVMFCLAFIFFNGEEFVNTPKLKQD